MSGFPTRIDFADALAIVADAAQQRRLPAERIALARAHGCVLRQDVVAGIDLPAFDNSAMDGFALRQADCADTISPLRLVGEQFAGPVQGIRIVQGECARITTGAPLPAGSDCVVMKENTRLHGDLVEMLAVPQPGQHVRHAGEDMRAGDTVLSAGEVLTPARISLTASLGLADVEVARRPTIAVFATGDELVEPGMPLQPGQIYNSNRELLMGLLRADGLQPTAWPSLPDDPGRIETALRDAASSFDVVVTCGAVSAGEKDHIPDIIRAHGRIHFWKVRMRPGMPLLFGELGQAAFLGLPGNPVSVLATWLTLGRPLLDGLQGRTEPRLRLQARLDAPWSKRHDRLEFLRGRLHSGHDGVLRVQPNPADGSHRMRGAADSDALIVLAGTARDYPRGEVVPVLLL